MEQQVTYLTPTFRLSEKTKSTYFLDTYLNCLAGVPNTLSSGLKPRPTSVGINCEPIGEFGKKSSNGTIRPWQKVPSRLMFRLDDGVNTVLVGVPCFGNHGGCPFYRMSILRVPIVSFKVIYFLV